MKQSGLSEEHLMDFDMKVNEITTSFLTARDN
jgi:hypothetical protein